MPRTLRASQRARSLGCRQGEGQMRTGRTANKAARANSPGPQGKRTGWQGQRWLGSSPPTRFLLLCPEPWLQETKASVQQSQALAVPGWLTRLNRVAWEESTLINPFLVNPLSPAINGSKQHPETSPPSLGTASSRALVQLRSKGQLGCSHPQA